MAHAQQYLYVALRFVGDDARVEGYGDRLEQTWLLKLGTGASLTTRGSLYAARRIPLDDNACPTDSERNDCLRVACVLAHGPNAGAPHLVFASAALPHNVLLAFSLRGLEPLGPLLLADAQQDGQRPGEHTNSRPLRLAGLNRSLRGIAAVREPAVRIALRTRRIALARSFSLSLSRSLFFTVTLSLSLFLAVSSQHIRGVRFFE